MLEWVIIGEDVGKKLIDFLTERVGDRYSSKAIKRALETNALQINGKVERFASKSLRKKDYIIFDEAILKAPSAAPKYEEKRILFEDDNLLIYDKPSGVSCDPEGILKLLRPRFRNLHLIHRLDKETTGVLLLAKNKQILDRMKELFKAHKVKKCYWAIVDGVVEEKKGNIKSYLIKKYFTQGQTILGSTTSTSGMFAQTDWHRLKQGKTAALVACYPITGRMHQIRVHLSEMGHPILGDHQYGKEFFCSYHAPRILLHAYEVSFEYDGRELKVQASLPDDFVAAQKAIFERA